MRSGLRVMIIAARYRPIDRLRRPRARRARRRGRPHGVAAQCGCPRANSRELELPRTRRRAGIPRSSSPAAPSPAASIERQPLDAVAAAEAVDLRACRRGRRSRSENRFFHSVQLACSQADLLAARCAAARSRCPRPACPRSRSARSPSTCVKSPRNQRARSIRWTPWSISSPPPDDLGVGAPLPVVAEAAAVAVAAADEHQRPERARVDELARLLERGMIAVVEADADADARAFRPRRSRGRSFVDGARRRLLDQDVLAGLDRRERRSARARRWWWRRSRRRRRSRRTASRQSCAAAAPVAGVPAPRRAPATAIGAGDERAPSESARDRFCPIRPQPTIATRQRHSSPQFRPRSSGRCGAACRCPSSASSLACCGQLGPRIPDRAEQLAGDAVARGRGEEDGRARRLSPAARRPPPSASASGCRTSSPTCSGPAASTSSSSRVFSAPGAMRVHVDAATRALPRPASRRTERPPPSTRRRR